MLANVSGLNCQQYICTQRRLSDRHMPILKSGSLVAADEKLPESKSTAKKEPVEKGKKVSEKTKPPPGELYGHYLMDVHI